MPVGATYPLCHDAPYSQVRGWERTLNRVNETLDMWYMVQRKWMYLESIFVGAEDIRLQLPEEAKKFDAIDKAFKQARAHMGV